ncbi:MAG: hypothetical protein Altm1KO_29130 [Alteromonas macleodii]
MQTEKWYRAFELQTLVCVKFNLNTRVNALGSDTAYTVSLVHKKAYEKVKKSLM